MKASLKPLASQVVVITGATSGIGLTTARMAAAEGAALVLAARDGAALRQLAAELEAGGADVLTVATDVGVRTEVEQLGQAAIARFGRIDTWVNNAGISMFGRHEEVSEEDGQRLFQTNFWGVVHGSLEALRQMRDRGGALINLGSELSDCAVPLQGMYAASKHAVKGFTDSLRMEIERDRIPISVTLIKPAAIDTMFTAHARNYLPHEPQVPPPVYAPELVARAILHAASHRRRDIYVGGASRLMSLGNFHLPRLFDRLAEATMFRLQQSDRPALPDRRDALHASGGNALQQRSGLQQQPVCERSPYTSLSLRAGPLMTALLWGGAAYAAYAACTAVAGTRARSAS
ncbi:short-chain dehydrogenase [Duganella sp. Leaf126]|uniref:SDR family oxidoreductase n=1 Tax=Duganella sp. Leaf126 TaxID=1736266 RepID=UPI0007004CD6|nr:SDR family oxidoreductase [Duganella sp. Leaf126]KQQ40123.1 short-chain dehydrogenase [Duganella sp. Leaf126]